MNSPDQSLRKLGQTSVRSDKQIPAIEQTISSSQIPNDSSSSHDRIAPAFAADASIVLVGIRGCGKRSLGFIAATALGRRFITEDHYFRATTGLSRQDYLKLHGSEEFHKHDVEISRQMLEEHGTGCVIDCGLGSLTSALQEYLKTYCLKNPIIHILRDMTNIKSLLKLSDRSVKLLENGDTTHRRCSNYEYFNLEDQSSDLETDIDGLDRGSPSYSFKLRHAQADFSRFVQLLTGVLGKNEEDQSALAHQSPLYSEMFTHALQVPFSAYEDANISLATLESGGDVLEILVDRWKSGATRTLSRMVADVRRQLRIPILITVKRSLSTLEADHYSAIVKLGIRLAVDFLAIDPDFAKRAWLDRLITRKPTSIIADISLSKNKDSNKSPWTDGTAQRRATAAFAEGYDMVRLLYQASCRGDNEEVSHFFRTSTLDIDKMPRLIAYNTGRLGRTSQIFNRTLTSVTHPLLKDVVIHNTMCNAQLTARESLQGLFASFVLDPLKFTIIGGNVSGSLSPAMHNAAYELLGLNHTYTTKNIKSWSDVEELSREPDFGGASIVQPWKVRLANKVDHLSEHARIIGAINTLVPIRASSNGNPPDLRFRAAQRNQAGPITAWYGDNTDWIAMSSCISRSLSPRNVIQSKTTALVVGAGGMARAAIYAITKLGCKNIFIYNRTIENAERLATHYNAWLFTNRERQSGTTSAVVRVLRSHEDQWPADQCLPTIVVSCVTHEHLDGNPDSNFTMPEAWLKSESGGVVVELAYMTRETPLTRQIKRYRHITDIPWIVVDGIETLFEQALAQFEIMTGKTAPPRRMREALNRAIHERQTFVADGEEFEVV